LSIEICIINPNATAKSNEKLKNCALKIIDPNSNIYISQENLENDYFSHHLETTNVSSLIKQIENNNSSDAFIIASYEDMGVETIRRVTSKPVIGIGEASFYTANIIANKFSVITNISQSHEALKNNLIKYDMDHK